MPPPQRPGCLTVVMAEKKYIGGTLKWLSIQLSIRARVALIIRRLRHKLFRLAKSPICLHELFESPESRR